MVKQPALAHVAFGLSTGVQDLAALAMENAWALMALVLVGLMITSVRGRLALLVGGVLATAGTSGDVSALKLAVMALCTLLGLISFWRVTRRGGTGVDTDVRRWTMQSTGLMFLAIVLGASTGLVRGAPLSAIARDSVAYVILLAALPIGVDSARAFSPARARRWVIALGIVSATAFLANTVAVRGFATAGGLAGILLGSFPIVALGVAVSLVEAQTGRNRVVWLLAAAGQIGAVLLTGTRTGFALFAGLLGILGRRRSGSPGIARLLITLAAMGSLAGIMIVVLAPHLVGMRFLLSRLTRGIAVLQGNVNNDMSAVQRSERYAIALQIVEDNPLVGHGLGGFAYGDTAGLGFTYYLDTPLLIPAKLGIVGMVLLAASLLTYTRGMLRACSPTPLGTRAKLSVRAFVWILIASTPFGAITENKGFGVSLALAAVLALSTQRERSVADSGIYPSAQTGPLVKGPRSAA